MRVGGERVFIVRVSGERVFIVRVSGERVFIVSVWCERVWCETAPVLEHPVSSAPGTADNLSRPEPD